jgi:hypothetical protein
LTEYVNATGLFKFTPQVEDREFFGRKLPPHYATKLATENEGFTPDALAQRLDAYPDMVVFFSKRHPVDCCLSKIVRGQTKDDGGDCEVVCPDGTVDGAMMAMLHADSVLQMLRSYYPTRLCEVKLEELVLNTALMCKVICEFLDVEVPDDMTEAYKRNRNRHHQARYGDELDKSTAHPHHNLVRAFGGAFADRVHDVDKIRRHLEVVIMDWWYV